MWGLIARGVAWASQIALGWAVSDIYNESKTSDQIAGATGGEKLSWGQKIINWLSVSFLPLIVILGVFAGAYMLFVKLFKR